MTARGALVLALAAFTAGPACAEEPRSLALDDARIAFDGEELVAANSRIERRWRWNDGMLATVRLGFGDDAGGWTMTGTEPDIAPFGEAHTTGRASLALRRIAATAMTPAHLELSVETIGDGLDTRRTCQVFPGVPAITCALAYRGSRSAAAAQTPLALEPVEDDGAAPSMGGDAIERLALPRSHWAFTVARFRAATDHHDWLVEEDEGELYRAPLARPGNVALLADRFGPGQIFAIKHAPLGSDQVAWPGHDFVLGESAMRIEGSGIDPAVLTSDRWHEAYATTIGVAAPGRLAALLAIRDALGSLRRYDHARDGMILMNTWGDRNRDAAMSEDFALAQLEAAHRLGLTHLQLDDGWQAGLSRNSASSEGVLWEEWTREAWRPHPTRFPRGLGPVVERARALGIEIALWFNPTRADDYAMWRRDADILIGLYREHGIRIFKIDGVDLPTRAAAANLERMLEAVCDATGGRAVFNLDVTAGRRAGYFDRLNRYGNIFVENRYTDWGNYYPYRTLRNLWMLSAYVPPQFLQMEFLNTWRNPDRYRAGDPLAPATAGFDYAFASVMMAQPLAWFEATGLPEEAFASAGLIRAYRAHAEAIHAGRILPIGDRPDGTAWTGFQSIGQDDSHGYLLILREANRRIKATVRTHLPPDERVRLDLILGTGRSREVVTGAMGEVAETLPAPHSFALYRYRLISEK